jgi:hypothetical protein
MPLPLAALAIGAGTRAVAARLGTSFLGKHLVRGAGEAFGMQYTKAGISRGFLGLGKKPLTTALRMPQAFYKTATKRGIGTAASKIGLKGAFRLAAPLYTAFSMYQGYQEEGVWGAAKGAAESVLGAAAFNVGAAILGGPVMWGIAAAAVVGGGAYAFGEAAQEHRKRIRGLEFATASMDVIGSAGALTDRARAMQALSNSHVNGRIALGNEGLLMHSSYR